MANSSKKSNPIAIIITAVIFIITIRIIRNADNPKTKDNVSSPRSKGYEITFGENFKKGLASQDDLGISIIVGVDTSGSMGETARGDNAPKYRIASQSMSEIVGFLESIYNTQFKKENLKLKLGILKFSSSVDVLYDLTEMDMEKFKDLKRIVGNPNTFSPDGGTAIGDTMEKGIEMLSQSGTIFRSLIVITDGENTQGVDPAKVMKAMVENRNNKNTEDYPVLTSTILTSFVGFDINASVFQNLNDLGARVTSAQNREQLNQSLRTIFVADITKLESGK